MSVGIGMVGVVGLCFKGQDGFETLVKCTSPVFCFFFLLTGAALIVLRFKDRGIERPFVSPAYPVTPLVFCFFCGFMLYGSVTYAPCFCPAFDCFWKLGLSRDRYDSPSMTRS